MTLHNTRFKYFLVALATAAGLFSGTAAAKPAYGELFVFGDSFSDMGTRYLDGNGPTVPFYLAGHLGAKLANSKEQGADGMSIDFAATAAGSGVDKGTDEWCCQGMVEQANDFAARVKVEKIKFNPETTLFLLEGGLNDADLSTDTTIANIRQQIEILQGVGAKHFSLSLLPTRIPEFSKVGKRLNPAYLKLAADLKMKSNVDIVVNHWGSYLDDILKNPKPYGIVNTTEQCAGRALFNEDATPCATPDAYFYFHSSHPSTAVNKIVADKLYKELSGSKAIRR